jgi:antitoxin component of MazEF toxin-antitoxin module
MARISPKNKVKLPKAALRAAGLRAGEKIVIEPVGGGELRLRSASPKGKRSVAATNGTDPVAAQEELQTPVADAEPSEAPVAAVEPPEPAAETPADEPVQAAEAEPPEAEPVATPPASKRRFGGMPPADPGEPYLKTLRRRRSAS